MAGGSQLLAWADLARDGLSDDEATALAVQVNASIEALPPAACWQHLTRKCLRPDLPFSVHLAVYDAVFADWKTEQGPRPAWTPGDVSRTLLAALMRERGFQSFADLWRWSTRDRPAFWGEMIARLGVRFGRVPDAILEPASDAERATWLPGARLNIVDTCLAAPADAVAVVAPGTDGGIAKVTYRDLAEQIAQVAAGLEALGCVPGDVIGLDMPMTPKGVAAYLGIIHAGMVAVTIAESLAADEVATRIRLTTPKLIFTTHDISRGGRRLPLYQKILAATPPRMVVIDADAHVLREGDLAWEDFLRPSSGAPSFQGSADTAVTFLFSSGTTADPKVIPWTHLTAIKAAADAALHFDIKSGDVVAWPTSLGWMMGPWLVFATLVNRATMALFPEAPTLRSFGAFVEQAKVTVLGTVPSIVKSWRRFDRMRGFDWSAIKCFGSTGETSHAVDGLYLMMLAGYRPIIEYCGGTELGGGYMSGTLVQPASPGTFTTPALGTDFVVLDEEGRPSDDGEVFLVGPLLGASQRLHHQDHHEIYFKGTPAGPAGEALRRHGDRIARLPGGTFRALGRMDDTMNLGGIKIGAAEIERIVDVIPSVHKTAVIAVTPVDGGPSELVVYATVDAGVDRIEMLTHMQAELNGRLGYPIRISELVFVDEFPTTPSNKIMRRLLRDRHVSAPALVRAGDFEEARARIRRFIVSSVGLLPHRTVADDESLVAADLLDSTAVLEVATFLEATFGVSLRDEDLAAAHLDSINSMAALVTGHKGLPGPPTLAAAQPRSAAAKASRFVGEMARLADQGRYDVIADELLSRTIGPNSLLCWDKFFVVGCGSARTADRAIVEPVLASNADIDQLCERFPERASRFRERHADGQECYVFHDQGRVVARQWLIPDRASYASLSGWTFVPPTRPAVWVHDLFVDPGYRVRGHFVGFMNNALRKRDGRSPHVYAEVHFRNEASLRSCMRYGFEPIHEVTVWRLLGLRFYSFARGKGRADGAALAPATYIPRPPPGSSPLRTPPMAPSP